MRSTERWTGGGRARGAAAAAAAAALLAVTASGFAAGRAGGIQFSDGETLEGALSLSPGRKLRVHTGDGVNELELAAVHEIRLWPERELLERKWRFIEAGQAAKEWYGEPYPRRHLGVTVVLGNGVSIEGHLYTTPLYVERDDGNRRVVLPAKQRGKEGEALADLVYPTRIVFADAAKPDAGEIKLTIAGSAEDGPPTVVALTHGALLRLAARPGETANTFRLPSPRGADAFLAVRSRAAGMRVGWPGGDHSEARALVDAAMPHVKDFFDDRTVLAAWLAEDDDVYALMMLKRRGKTTLGRARSQPWRLGLWRWKRDDDRLMLAGRGYFFRGILSPGAEPPPVTCSAKLWTPELADGMLLSADDGAGEDM